MSDNKVQESSSDKTSDAKSMAATATKEKAKKKQSFGKFRIFDPFLCTGVHNVHACTVYMYMYYM